MSPVVSIAEVKNPERKSSFYRQKGNNDKNKREDQQVLLPLTPLVFLLDLLFPLHHGNAWDFGSDCLRSGGIVDLCDMQCHCQRGNALAPVGYVLCLLESWSVGE